MWQFEVVQIDTCSTVSIVCEVKYSMHTVYCTVISYYMYMYVCVVYRVEGSTVRHVWCASYSSYLVHVIRTCTCVPRTCTTSRYTTFLVMVKWTATKKKWKPEWFYFFITLHVAHVECSCQLSTTRQLLFFKKIGYPI